MIYQSLMVFSLALPTAAISQTLYALDGDNGDWVIINPVDGRRISLLNREGS